jgi:hypothetical protein
MQGSKFGGRKNILNKNDVGQTEIHTAEPLVPEPRELEAQMAIENLKSYKSPSVYQIPAELIEVASCTIYSAVYKLINSVRNKEELP